jgi:hypothetical protein
VSIFRVDAANTISLLLAHKDVVFDLIDHMDEKTDSYGIDLTRYNSTFRRYINKLKASKTERTEAERLQIAFEIENLQQNGLIVSVDKNEANQITFQPFFIDMFRHFDNKRIKSLSNAEYEGIRTNFVRLCDELHQTEIHSNNENFNELYSNINSALSETLSLIKRNTDALKGSATRLAEYIDNIDLDESLHNSGALEKLEELAKLYERKVIPSLEFLNPEQRLVKQATFGKVLEDIEDQLIDKYPERSASIQYRHAEISGYYKDIKVVENTLLAYYKRHKRSRHVFNAMETLFNKLSAEALECHDGKLNKNYISLSLDEGKQSVSLQNNLLIGLKSNSQSSGTKIGWQSRFAVSDLKEAVRVYKEEIGQAEEVKVLKKQDRSNSLARKREENKRKAELIRVVNQLEKHVLVDDLFEYLHKTLKNHFDDYQLIDAMHGYRHFSNKPAVKNRLLQTTDYRTIAYQGKVHQYWRRTLKEV